MESQYTCRVCTAGLELTKRLDPARIAIYKILTNGDEFVFCSLIKLVYSEDKVWRSFLTRRRKLVLGPIAVQVHEKQNMQ